MTSTFEWYRSGGPFMPVILVVALVGLAVVLERVVVLVVHSRLSGRDFIERVVQLVRADRLDEAIGLCARSKAVLADLGLLILRSRSRDEADLVSIAAAAAKSVIPRLSRRLGYLPALAIVAALLGGAGAALGARRQLLSAGVRAGAPDSPLAAGLAALSFGLAAAAALVAAHAWLASQAELLVAQAEELSSRLINALTERADVRLGHR